MSTFGEEEDKAIAAQFDGEELVKDIGGLAGKGSITKDIKHANPKWVLDKSSKWGKSTYQTEEPEEEEEEPEAEAKTNLKVEVAAKQKQELAQENQWIANLWCY